MANENFTFADGYFPFCVPVLSPYNATTNPNGYTEDDPEITIQQAVAIFWRVKKWAIKDLTGALNVSVTDVATIEASANVSSSDEDSPIFDSGLLANENALVCQDRISRFPLVEGEESSSGGWSMGDFVTSEDNAGLFSPLENGRFTLSIDFALSGGGESGFGFVGVEATLEPFLIFEFYRKEEDELNKIYCRIIPPLSTGANAVDYSGGQAGSGGGDYNTKYAESYISGKKLPAITYNYQAGAGEDDGDGGTEWTFTISGGFGRDESVEVGEITLKMTGFDDLIFKLWAAVNFGSTALGEPPADPGPPSDYSVTGDFSYTIEALEYWEYGDRYDKDTGADILSGL
jgi:hypothetical protein